MELVEPPRDLARRVPGFLRPGGRHDSTDGLGGGGMLKRTRRRLLYPRHDGLWTLLEFSPEPLLLPRLGKCVHSLGDGTSGQDTES